MLLGKTMKLTTIPLALLAVLCLGGNPDSCDALSIQSDRRINHGCAKSPDHEDSDVSPKLFNVKCPPPHLSIHNFSFPEPVVSTGRRKKISIHSRSNIFREIHEQRTPLPRCSLLHSLAVVASCRRLSFFILSVSLVNYIRSSVLKVSLVRYHVICTHKKRWLCILHNSDFGPSLFSLVSGTSRYRKAANTCLMSVPGHSCCSTTP